jgi:hypothetical protein
VVSKGGCALEWEKCWGLECYNNIRLFRRGKGREQERHVGNLVPESVDIRFLGY